MTEGNGPDIIVAPSREEAGLAIRRYWENLLAARPLDFIEKIGGWGVIVAWLNKNAYAPDPEVYADWPTFLGFVEANPEWELDIDAMASYDAINVSPALIEACGFVPTVAFIARYKKQVR